MSIKIRTNGNITILEPTGSLDISNAHQMRQVMVDAISAESSLIVVNLQDLSFVDSSGLAVLLHGLKRARGYHGNLCLCSLQPPVRMIFELTRFDKIFEIFINEEDAVLAAAGQY